MPAKAADSVPSVYFKAEFDFSKGETFREVYPSDMSSAKAVRERLETYQDCVELELMEKLSKRSKEFFKALRDLQDLHHVVSDTYEGVESIGNSLEVLDKKIVLKTLNIVQKRTRKTNLTTVWKKVCFLLLFLHIAYSP